MLQRFANDIGSEAAATFKSFSLHAIA